MECRDDPHAYVGMRIKRPRHSVLCVQGNAARPERHRTRTDESGSPLDPDAEAVDDGHRILANSGEEPVHRRDYGPDGVEKDMANNGGFQPAP